MLEAGDKVRFALETVSEMSKSAVGSMAEMGGLTMRRVLLRAGGEWL